MKWKEIPNTDGLYLISSEGKVFSVRSNKVLRNQQIKNGYWRIELNVDGEKERHFIHRLVAEAFLPNPDNLPCVNHKDENPSNNCVDNLEWCTHSYNTNYGNRLAKFQEHIQACRGSANPQSKTIYQYDLEGNYIAKYGSAGEAERVLLVDGDCVLKCARGQLKQYKGYVFQFEEGFRGYNKRQQCGFRKGAILQYDLDGNLVRRYDKAQDLEEAGFSQISVNRVCRGERKSYKGYIFKHENEA